jgi:hypothetical protein
VPLQTGAMQQAHVRHTSYTGQVVYAEHKLLEIFERVIGGIKPLYCAGRGKMKADTSI